MKNLTSSELRKIYLDYYKSKGHAVISSASLIPENDPTVLFTTAGMHPLVPYLLGEKHPAGNRLTDVQICVRTGDIEEVGDPTHCTFFEMLGRWSLGDYFKEYAISCSYDFLLNRLEFDKDKFAVTVFKGDEDCPRDDESAEFWKKMGVPEDRIFFLPKENNWWGPAGVTGPCGPDTLTPENPNVRTNVRPRATAASTSKSVTTSLCNTSKTPTAPSRRLNKRTSTREWGLNVCFAF